MILMAQVLWLVSLCLIGFWLCWGLAARGGKGLLVQQLKSILARRKKIMFAGVRVLLKIWGTFCFSIFVGAKVVVVRDL